MSTTDVRRTRVPAALVRHANGCFGRIPHSFIALLARLSIAAVFWRSGPGSRLPRSRSLPRSTKYP